MESVTKYLNGHSDVVMGAVATNRQDLYERLVRIQIGESPLSALQWGRRHSTLQTQSGRQRGGSRDADRGSAVRSRDADGLSGQVTYGRALSAGVG